MTTQQLLFASLIVERVNRGVIFSEAVAQVEALPASVVLVSVNERAAAVRLARQALLDQINLNSTKSSPHA